MEDNSNNYTIWLIIVFGIIIWFFLDWGKWFQNDDQVRTDCLSYISSYSTISDYKTCLVNHHIDSTDKDIRQGCQQVAKLQFEDQNSNKPSESSLYISCVRSEGLPN